MLPGAAAFRTNPPRGADVGQGSTGRNHAVGGKTKNLEKKKKWYECVKS